jgi:hypothetical protein
VEVEFTVTFPIVEFALKEFCILENAETGQKAIGMAKSKKYDLLII